MVRNTERKVLVGCSLGCPTGPLLTNTEVSWGGGGAGSRVDGPLDQVVSMVCGGGTGGIHDELGSAVVDIKDKVSCLR